MADEPQADRGYHWSEHATRDGVQGAGREHHHEDRPDRGDQCTRPDRHQCDGGKEADRADGVDQRPGWHLPDQRDHSAGAQHQADLDLRPRMAREIDRDERPKSGLNVGEKENKPVEAAGARPRQRGTVLRRDMWRWSPGPANVMCVRRG